MDVPLPFRSRTDFDYRGTISSLLPVTPNNGTRPSPLSPPSIILRYIAVLGKEGSLIECEEETRLRNRLCEHDCQL